MASVSISELVKAFGAYYIDSGQNMKNILRMLTQGSVTPSYMSQVKTNDSVFRMATYALGEIVQPFTKDWNPSDPGKFIPNEIQKRKIKIDLDVYPDDIDDSWAGFLASSNLAKKDWPLIKFLIENYIIPRIQQDMETQVYYKGVYKAPVSGQPKVANDVMDGIEKCLQTGVNKGTVNILTGIGVLSKATVLDQVEAAIDQISDIYQGTEMIVCMAPVFARAYLRDKRSQGVYQLSSDKNLNLGIDFSPNRVVPLPSMGASTDMFITPKANLLHVTDKTMNKETFKIEESKRCVSILTDWHEGVGFGIDEVVWTNKAKTTV